MSEIFTEGKDTDLKAKAVRGAGINIVAQFLGFLCQTAGVVLLARLLTPEDFGIVAMVTVFSLWLMNFGVNGLTEFIIQKQDISTKEINAIFWSNLFVSILLALGLTISGFLLVDFYAEPALSGITAVMATGIIFQALFTCQFALLKREMKFALISSAELIAAILSVIFAIGIALAGMGYWAVVTRQLTIPLVTMIAAWIFSSWRPGRPHSLAAAIPGLKYAVHVYFNISLGFLMKSMDKVLLGKFHGAVLLGNYDRAYHLFSVPTSQIISPLNSVALSTLSRLKHDKERFSAYYAKAISIVTFPGILAALLLTLCAQDLVHLLLGPSWTETGLIVMAFGPGLAATFMYSTSSWLHLSLGTPDRWLRWNLFATVITVIAFVIAAPYGAVAMALAFSGRTCVLIVPGLWYAGRPINLRIGLVMRSVLAYVVSAVSVSILWFILYKYWFPIDGKFMGLSPLNRIIVTAISSSFCYLTLVIILQRSLKSVQEILSLIPLILPNRNRRI